MRVGIDIDALGIPRARVDTKVSSDDTLCDFTSPLNAYINKFLNLDLTL